jgi:hypothetical protein
MQQFISRKTLSNVYIEQTTLAELCSIIFIKELPWFPVGRK